MKFKKEAFGSILEIITKNDIDKNTIQNISNIVINFEKKYSRFIKGNFLDNLNRSGRSTIDVEFKTIFNVSKKLYIITDGYFDITILPILENMGYGKEKSDLKNIIGLQKIKIIENEIFLNGTKIDFGAIGKGYIIDTLYNILKKEHNDLIINFGGDLKIGETEKIIGLEDPFDDKKIIGKIKVKDLAFGSSSGQKRKFGKNHHLINPFNSNSQNDKIVIYLTHKLATFADAFSTALFVTPLEKSIEILKETSGLEGLIIDNNGGIYKSAGFDVDLYGKNLN